VKAVILLVKVLKGGSRLAEGRTEGRLKRLKRDEKERSDSRGLVSLLYALAGSHTQPISAAACGRTSGDFSTVSQIEESGVLPLLSLSQIPKVTIQRCGRNPVQEDVLQKSFFHSFPPRYQGYTLRSLDRKRRCNRTTYTNSKTLLGRRRDILG
jgi:hypothetical protein